MKYAHVFILDPSLESKHPRHGKIGYGYLPNYYVHVIPLVDLVQVQTLIPQVCGGA